jgi:RNA polymerase sigma factor (sigma-70 family)
MPLANRKPQSRSNLPAKELDRLIAEARAGSTAALDTLIGRLSDHLWAQIGLRRKPRGLSPSRGLSDLVQDTLLRVREKFHKFERQTFADFQQWAQAVLHRRQQEWIRNYRAANSAEKKEKILLAIRGRLDTGLQNGSAVDPIEWREETSRASEAFERLKPNERFIVNLRLLEALRYKDISSMTGWSEEAARKAYDRALCQLRKLYEANGAI